MSALVIRRHSPVSIVIPVFNRLELTRQCLASIWQHTHEDSIEIIVVDNSSTDGTADELMELQDEGRLRVFVQGENQGFARACNLGALAASHRYILFLNNDTEVTAGWLEPLVTTLDADARVGAAGSKLLFPDGTIQHAGVAFVREEKQAGAVLLGDHLCYRKPSDYRPANHPQLMRALSAASLLVRREAFDQVGGFDEQYWNGNEDLDLGLKLTEKSWDLVYRPESVVVHYESQSGDERWSKVTENIVLFNERWLDKIEPDYYRDDDGVLRASPQFSIRTYAQPRLTFSDTAGAVGDRPVASVIVLTHNALEYTRLCVDSLLEHTDERHELIFVDNASSDGTVKYLRHLGETEPNFFAIYNQENLGFAAGNNQGLAFATGKYVVLLNSDTVVTDNWLETMIQAAEDHPQAGLVGPVTNSINGSQKLPRVGYDQETLKDLDLFARMHCSATRGNDELVMWLSGFCLLIRRDLVARIGGLDERYGLGNFEDNDYCLRSFLAGYQSIIATDCLVHHFGSKSFEAAKLDYDTELEAKWEIFKAKWNIPLETPYGEHFDLERILLEGFDPVLHFHPLPLASTVALIPPSETEIEAVLARGEEAFANQRPEDAETLFRWVLQWSETHSRAGNNLAVTLWHLGHADQAITTLLAILANDPDDSDAVWNLKEIRKAEKENQQLPSAAPDGTPAEDTAPRETPVA